MISKTCKSLFNYLVYQASSIKYLISNKSNDYLRACSEFILWAKNKLPTSSNIIILLELNRFLIMNESFQVKYKLVVKYYIDYTISGRKMKAERCYSSRSK